MQEFKIASKKSDELLKVELNEYGDYIVLNAGDATFVERYNNFLKYMDVKSAELSQKAKEFEEIYGDKPMIEKKEDGNINIDSKQLGDFLDLQLGLYRDLVKKLDNIFGLGTIKKYFRDFYDINPEFVPDDECIKDFLEQIAPAISMVYGIREKKISGKYNKARKGRKPKSKAELLFEAKAAKVAESDD